MRNLKVDAHQHFWHYTEAEYSWIGETDYVLKRDFLPKDLRKELKSLSYAGSIAVQARQSLEETRWLLSLADKTPEIKAVVGWVDLQSDELEEQLNEFCKNPKFKGVRHVIQDEPDDDFILSDRFVKGISLLSGYNLIYELLIYPEHLRFATELVRMFPNQKFVLDHIAKPQVKDKLIDDWTKGVHDLASCENVSVKISGLVTEADHKSWSATEFYPYLDVIWETFGEDRIMVGSDWPVCLLAASYSQVICLAEGYFESLNSQIIDKVFGLNARRLYGI